MSVGPEAAIESIAVPLAACLFENGPRTTYNGPGHLNELERLQAAHNPIAVEFDPSGQFADGPVGPRKAIGQPGHWASFATASEISGRVLSVWDEENFIVPLDTSISQLVR